MKCGRPIECASDRACATADAEQQLRSPSFSGSDHSSSVTATASRGGAHQQRRDRAVDAAAHRDERAAASGRGAAQPRAARRRCRARGPAHRRRARRRGACRRSARPAPLRSCRLRPARRRAPTPAHEGHRRAAGRGRRAAPPRLEAGIARRDSPSIATEKLISSQQRTPPAVAVKPSAGRRPRPCGEVRWCSNASVSTGARIDARRAALPRARARRRRAGRSRTDRVIADDLVGLAARGR